MEEEYERNLATSWSSKHSYEIGLISSVLGLSNAMSLFINLKYIGPIFLGPYILFTLLTGTPMVILELCLSQYGQKGLIQVWAMCPIFRGLGFMSLIYLFTVLVEHLTILTFLIRYMLNSFSSQTGWDTCTNSWNTYFCYTLETNTSRRMDCYDLYSKQICDAAVWETSHNQYWHFIVQRIEYNMFQTKNLIYCFGMMLFLFVLSFKGLELVEKFICFFLTIAAIGFTILFYCSLIQHGSVSGLRHFLVWDFSLLSEKKVWVLGFEQAIVSLGLGSGGLITLGSQNYFRGNSYMNSMMLILVEITVTFLYAALYSCLCGNLSYFSNLEIVEVMSSQEMELWSKIPRMLEHLQGPVRFWQFLFYTQVFVLVTSKVLVMMFVFTKTIFVIFPRTEKFFVSTTIALYCTVFIFCLPLFTIVGKFIRKQVIELIIRGPMIILINVLQTAGMLYCYGLATVVNDIHFMLGFRLNFYFQVMLFLMPIILCTFWILGILYFHEIEDELLEINDTRKFILYAVMYLPLFVTVGYALWYARLMIWRRKWDSILTPHDSWYLSDPILRKSRQMFSAMSMTKEYLYRQSKRLDKIRFYRDGVIFK